MGKLIIRPADNWRWFYDEKYGCLMLDLSNDMVFRSRYPTNMLIADALESFPFSVDDATAYYQFYEQCYGLNLSEPEKVELVLNAIVAANFLKPQMPKSWYFIQQPMLFTPQFAEMVEAQVQNSGERINLLVVEAGESASVCLIVQKQITMVGKSFTMSDVVKVMNDRLATKNSHQQHDIEDEFEESEMIDHFLHQAH